MMGTFFVLVVIAKLGVDVTGTVRVDFAEPVAESFTVNVTL